MGDRPAAGGVYPLPGVLPGRSPDGFHDIVDVMAALGAWRVWTGSAATCGSYDHREHREVHLRQRESPAVHGGRESRKLR